MSAPEQPRRQPNACLIQLSVPHDQAPLHGAQLVERGDGRCRWDAVALEQRAAAIGRFWATTTGQRVAVEDARRIARLSLPLGNIIRALKRAAHPGTGAAWRLLREAERDYISRGEPTS